MTSTNVDFSPSLWNLSKFEGKRDLIKDALASVGSTTIYLQGAGCDYHAKVFSDDLSRFIHGLLVWPDHPDIIRVLKVLHQRKGVNCKNHVHHRHIRFFLGFPRHQLYSRALSLFSPFSQAHISEFEPLWLF